MRRRSCLDEAEPHGAMEGVAGLAVAACERGLGGFGPLLVRLPKSPKAVACAPRRTQATRPSMGDTQFEDCAELEDSGESEAGACFVWN